MLDRQGIPSRFGWGGVCVGGGGGRGLGERRVLGQDAMRGDSNPFKTASTFVEIKCIRLVWDTFYGAKRGLRQAREVW